MKRWLTRDGRWIKPSCMSCDHLRNAVSLILRKRWRMAWLPVLLGELATRCQPPPEPDFEDLTVISGMDNYGVLPD